MPITSKTHVVEELRHSEYYNMQSTFDDLYARSKNGETFENLMEAILSRENILLAYRNIKANHGSRTPGTDGRTIQDIANMESEEVVEYVRFIVIGSKHGYRPKPVRRKEIPKQNGKTRPLGIPCIWDRLVQQCIKQILEPICEAKFSDNSYGFRPNRCVEHAIAETHRLMQRSHMHYVIEFDIKGFFDNVNHSKLIKQLWTMGIQDRQLIFVIKRILKAPIRMPNGSTLIPSKGTPQGGIISPLLANVVLNELDWWIEKQWYSNPVIEKFNCPKNKKGVTIKSGAYAAMRKTNLKEMYIIRYADDFRVFCRTKNQANRARIAITKWLEERLKLEVSEEKTRIVNVTTHYMEFLGFKLKLYSKGNKWRVKSHISDKKFILIRCNLKREYGNIAHAKNKAHATSLVRKYNATVLGIQNYYKIATDICKDCRKLQYVINAISKSQFHAKNSRLSKIGKTGRELTSFETKQYGRSRALRFLKSNGEPIYPIAFVQPSPPPFKD